MRLLLIGLVSIAILGCGLANLPLITIPQNAATPTTFAERMNEVANRDLENASKSTKAGLRKLLLECDPPIPTTEDENRFDVWNLWRLQDENVDGFLIVRVRPDGSVPGRSEVIIGVIDESGRQLTTSRFWTGWRHYISRFRYFNDSKLDSNILEITTNNDPWGPQVRQFYSVSPQHIGLIALRDSDEKLVPNKYKSDNCTIGPEVPWRTVGEWEQVLQSNKATDLLEALTWLGGVHRRDLRPSKDECLESLSSAELYAQLRANESVRTLVQDLVRSKDRRIAETAKLANEQLLSDKVSEW